jgi:hypothetical protein
MRKVEVVPFNESWPEAQNIHNVFSNEIKAFQIKLFTLAGESLNYLVDKK